MSRGLHWSLFSTACVAAGSLLITPAVVRALGPVEFGVYSLAIVFASYFGLFDLGLTWAATRYFTEDLARADHQALAVRFRTLQVFFLVIGAASTLVSVGVGPALMRAVAAPMGAQALLVLALGAVSFALALQIQLFGALLRAAQLFAAFGRAIALGSALLPLASYAAVRLGLGLVGLIIVNIAVNLVVLAVCWAASRDVVGSGQKTKVQWAYLRQMMSFGGWSTLSRVVMLVMLQMDRLAVAFVGQAAGLTYYAVPASLASRLNVLGVPAATLFFARASALSVENSGAELVRQYGTAVRLVLWTSVALSVPLITLGPVFLRFWIGPEMALRGGLILTVLAVGYFLSSISILHAATLEATGRPSWTAKNMLCWCIPAILGVLAGAPRYGSVAIASSLAAWQCGVAVTNVILCRRIGLGLLSKEWFETLTAALLTAALGMFFRGYIDGIATALAAMSFLGLIALAAGWMAILSSTERQLIVSSARRTLGHVIAFRVACRAYVSQP